MKKKHWFWLSLSTVATFIVTIVTIKAVTGNWVQETPLTSDVSFLHILAFALGSLVGLIAGEFISKIGILDGFLGILYMSSGFFVPYLWFGVRTEWTIPTFAVIAYIAIIIVITGYLGITKNRNVHKEVHFVR